MSIDNDNTIQLVKN